MEKKRNIMIVLSILLLVIVISSFFYYHKNKTYYITKDYESGLDLNSFYDENSLIFNRINKEQEETQYSYLEIEGLKKVKIENNINKSITKNMYEFAKENKNSKKVYVDVSGNFGNILSLVITVSDEEKNTNTKYLNYNLVTGEMLVLDNLFTQNAPIESIVKKTIKEQLEITKKVNCNYDETGNLIEESQACIELDSQLTSYLETFKNKLYQFYFNGVEVFIEIEDLTINIPYFEYPNYFNLYTKYLTNISIYKNDKIGAKDILVASYRDNGVYSILEELEENLYVDSAVLTTLKNVPEKVITGIENIVDTEISKIETAKNFIFLNQSNELTKELDSYYDKETKQVVDKGIYHIYRLTIRSHVYTMLPQTFVNSLKDTIFSKHRIYDKSYTNFITMPKNTYIDFSNTSKEFIILSNGKVLEEVDDLFVTGYDYKQVVEKKLIELLELTEKDYDKLEELSYDFQLYNKNVDTSYCIVITGIKIPKIYISFDEFDQSMMNVY